MTRPRELEQGPTSKERTGATRGISLRLRSARGSLGAGSAETDARRDGRERERERARPSRAPTVTYLPSTRRDVSDDPATPRPALCPRLRDPAHRPRAYTHRFALTYRYTHLTSYSHPCTGYIASQRTHEKVARSDVIILIGKRPHRPPWAVRTREHVYRTRPPGPIAAWQHQTRNAERAREVYCRR
jgi:hypothetical protein